MTTKTKDKYILFNNKTIERLPVADKGERDLYLDKKVEGLGLRVTDNGSKSFVVYRWFKGKPVRITLGQFNGDAKQDENFDKDPLALISQEDAKLDADQARKIGRVVVAELEAGNDVRLKRTTWTFGKLFERYIDEYAKPKNRRWQLMEADYKRYFQDWHDRKVSTIAPADVQSWFEDVSERGKDTANRQYNNLRAVINWGIKKRIISISPNPCMGIDKHDAKPRERFVLPGDEYKALAKAIDQEPRSVLRDFFWACLLTGARKANVLAMEWSEINRELQTWTIPGSKTKNGHSLTIPLTADALVLLARRTEDDDKDSQWVFPADSKSGHLIDPKAAWKRIINRAKKSVASLEDLRIHDLRRTVGSYMAISGISSTIIGKALGHRFTSCHCHICATD